MLSQQIKSLIAIEMYRETVNLFKLGDEFFKNVNSFIIMYQLLILSITALG